jgi:hypothetical protein
MALTALLRYDTAICFTIVLTVSASFFEISEGLWDIAKRITKILMVLEGGMCSVDVLEGATYISKLAY